MDYTYKQWEVDTKGSFGSTSGRSKELQALDEKFKSYEQAKTSIVRKMELKTALAAWKASVGPGDAWQKSARNKNRGVEKLDAMLGGTDEESAFNRGQVPDFMHESLVHSRMGVLYLFSNLSIQPGLFSLLIEGGLDITGQAFDVADVKPPVSLSTVAPVLKKGAEKVNSKIEEKIFKQRGPTVVSAQSIINAPATPPKLPPPVADFRTKIYEFFRKMVEGIKDKLRDKFGIIQDIGGMIPKVIAFVVNQVSAAAVPLAGSVVVLAQKIGGLCLAIQDKFQAWLDGKNVQINQGHPTTVVDSIKRGQSRAMLTEIYGVVAAAAGVAIDATAWGGGAIFNLVKSGVELILKFVWRLAEALRFNEFCSQARDYYVAAKSDIAGQTDKKAGAGSLPRRPFEFAQWYRSFALNMPIIAVLTLNSGVAGDKMSYLTMFSDNGQISSDEFQAGVRFLDNLKPWGAEYLQSSGFTIVAAGDVLVDALANTVAKGQLSELARKGGANAGKVANASGTSGPALNITSMGFANTRDVGKSNVRLGVERLFKGFAKG
jgi:hypothetical protein